MIWPGLKVERAFSSRSLVFLSSFGPRSKEILEFLKKNGLPLPIPLPSSSSSLASFHSSSPSSPSILHHSIPLSHNAPFSSISSFEHSPPSFQYSPSYSSSYPSPSSSSSFLPPLLHSSYFASVLEVYLNNQVFHKDLGELVNLVRKGDLLDKLSPSDNLKILEAMRVSGRYKEVVINKVIKNLNPHFSSLLPSQLASLLNNLAYFGHSGLMGKINQLEIRREYLGEMAFYCAVFFQEEIGRKVEEVMKRIEEELNRQLLSSQTTRLISHFLQTCILFNGEGASLLSRLPDRKRFLRISNSQRKFGSFLMKELQEKQLKMKNDKDLQDNLQNAIANTIEKNKGYNNICKQDKEILFLNTENQKNKKILIKMANDNIRNEGKGGRLSNEETISKPSQEEKNRLTDTSIEKNGHNPTIPFPSCKNDVQPISTPYHKTHQNSNPKSLYFHINSLPADPKEVPFPPERLKKASNNMFQLEEEKKLGVYHVDYIINSRFIVEINGPSHYLASFPRKENGYERSRRRNLERMGFEIIEVDMQEVKGEEGMRRKCREIVEKVLRYEGRV